ncbi:hypothetical protein GL50803_0014027 [Giardia duodenalis]|uniref:Uncharacterized protein n=1 Tax=Giardia intestinalis (strain ATCC 50803 / WB clone C6) TaxID=184922 RepID=A8B392_GIAIC|nr:hypothetical protein GL50803_0014027 [Giardia intestinalis]KAE8303126.1 hypothetical protein GL50803_0014027 [Giardia intestinalis]|eukprot:XP_001710156.1 Hypothetical protein GL50803_14027 [Giardia lamblia ATCC 50803]
MKNKQKSYTDLPNKEVHLEQTFRRGFRDRTTGATSPLLKCPKAESASLPGGGLSCNYLYMIMWPMWKAYLYIFLARLFYNGTLYVFLVLQFLISIHFCGFNGTLAFCNFIAFRELILNISSNTATRVFSCAAQVHQLTNDFTFVRGLLVLYFLVYICYSVLIILIVALLRQVFGDVLNVFPAIIKRFPQYDPELLKNYLSVMSLPLQGLGLGICTFISTENRYFLPGIIAFSSVLCSLFFQLLFLLSRTNIITHIQGSPSNVVLLLEGVPQIVFGIASVVAIVYVISVGRAPQLRKYNIFLHFRYIHRVDFSMIAKMARNMVALTLQHSIQPLLLLSIQYRVARTSNPFEYYCMQMLCVVMYYLLTRCSDTMVMSSSEAYAIVRGVYEQAGIAEKSWLLKLLFLGTALASSSLVLIFFQAYREKILTLSIPLAFRMHSNLFSMYFSNYNARYATAIWTCLIHIITSIFVTYFNVSVLFEESLLYSLSMIVYKYTLLVITVCVTLQHIAGDSALPFIFLIINVLTLPLYILRSFVSYNRMARKSKQTIEKEKAVCTAIFYDVLKS